MVVFLVCCCLPYVADSFWPMCSVGFCFFWVFFLADGFLVFCLNGRTHCQALGKSKENFVISSQMKSKKAWMASMRAAFNAFQTQLQADQALFEAQQIRTN